jgi:RimJ/RimL family protein N-acetyltransferase
LRPYRHGDSDDLYSYANDEAWSRYITPPHPYLSEYAETFIEERVYGHSNEWAGWCIEYEDRMVGSIDLILDATQQIGEIGIQLGPMPLEQGADVRSPGGDHHRRLRHGVSSEPIVR